MLSKKDLINKLDRKCSYNKSQNEFLKTNKKIRKKIPYKLQNYLAVNRNQIFSLFSFTIILQTLEKHCTE